MSMQQTPTVPAQTHGSNPRQSERARRPTQRFLEGGFEESLPRLSRALGIGATEEREAGRAGAAAEEVLSSDDNGLAATNPQAVDEAPVTAAMEQDQEGTVVGALGNRRSERERRATERFVNGWFGERLPRLSAALGVAVTDRQER